MELAASVADEVLVPGLAYTPPQVATYVQSRRHQTWWPAGSNVYSPAAGTRTVRFNLTDSAGPFLELSTLRLAYRITNRDGAKALQITGGTPTTIWGRARVMINGQLVEDSLYSNRVAGMLTRLLPNDRAWSNSIQNLGGVVPGTRGAGTSVSQYGNGPIMEPIPANGSRNIVSLLPPLGIASTHYLFPLRWVLSIELDLVTEARLCCATGNSNANSLDFRLEQVRLLGDSLVMDNAIQEQLSTTLLAGSPLSMFISTYSTVMNVIDATGGDFSVVLNIALTRIKAILITFDNDAAIADSPFYSQSNLFLCWNGWDGGNAGEIRENGIGGPSEYSFARDTFSAQLAVGSTLYPDYPIQSIGEAHYHLSKVLAHHSNLNGLAITPVSYRSDGFIMGIDLEKMSGSPAGDVALSGISTTGGEAIRLSWRGMDSRSAAFRPNRCWMTVISDRIVELRAEGVVVLS